MKSRPKVTLARRLRSRLDIQNHVSIFSTRGWFERAQAIKIRSMSKKTKQDIVDVAARRIGMSNILSKFKNKTTSDNK